VAQQQRAAAPRNTPRPCAAYLRRGVNLAGFVRAHYVHARSARAALALESRSFPCKRCRIIFDSAAA